MKAVAGTIFYNGLSKLLPADFIIRGHALPINYSGIKFIQPDVKAEVLHAVSFFISVQCLILKELSYLWQKYNLAGFMLQVQRYHSQKC